MLNTITLKKTRWVTGLQGKVEQILTYIHHFQKTHKSLFMKCAVVYMSIKIGILLLATFATMTFVISSVAQHLAIEMSKIRAILFASPLALIIMLKLYFIFKILMTYDRSGLVIKTVINTVLLKGGKGMQEGVEIFTGGVLQPSMNKVRNR